MPKSKAKKFIDPFDVGQGVGLKSKNVPGEKPWIHGYVRSVRPIVQDGVTLNYAYIVQDSYGPRIYFHEELVKGVRETSADIGH